MGDTPINTEAEAQIPKQAPEVSLVIPCLNDAISLYSLLEEILVSLSHSSFSFEIIVVDDGSRDPVIIKSCASDPALANVILLRHQQNLGKSWAWQTGFNEAKGRYIITLDADLQDNPYYINDFIAKLRQGYDVVAGVRQGWQNGLRRYLASRIYNRLVNCLFGTSIRDHNCGLKGFKADLVRGMHLDHGQHRLLVAILASKGATVSEIPVVHRPRTSGASAYGALRGLEFIHSVYKYWRKTQCLRRTSSGVCTQHMSSTVTKAPQPFRVFG